jgi:hypothetical protein
MLPHGRVLIPCPITPIFVILWGYVMAIPAIVTSEKFGQVKSDGSTEATQMQTNAVL